MLILAFISLYNEILFYLYFSFSDCSFSSLSHILWISCCHAGLICTTDFSAITAWNHSLHSVGLQKFDLDILLFKKLPSLHFPCFSLKRRARERLEESFLHLSILCFYPVASHCTNTVVTIRSILMTCKVMALISR